MPRPISSRSPAPERSPLPAREPDEVVLGAELRSATSSRLAQVVGRFMLVSAVFIAVVGGFWLLLAAL